MISKILFRCDADEKNGFGHFSRCLNIARAVRKQSDSYITFFGNYNEFASNLIHKYQMHQINASLALIGNPHYQFKLAKEYDYFILDSYFVDQLYIDHFVNQSFKFIKIDDFNALNLGQIDLVINFCIRAHEFNYIAKKVCLGVAYFPVREEMKALRMKNCGYLRRKVRNVVVCLGGTDRFGIGKEMVNVFDQVFQNIQITLITSQYAKKTYTSLHNNIAFMPMTVEIEKYLMKADMVITGGGLLKYESAYCCIPNAAISQTIEQDIETHSFFKEGLTYDLGMVKNFDKDNIVEKLTDFCSTSVREKIYFNSKQKFVTGSSRNLAKEIIQLNNFNE